MFNTLKKQVRKLARSLSAQPVDAAFTGILPASGRAALQTQVLRNLDEFTAYYRAMHGEHLRRKDVEFALTGTTATFSTPGYCYVCEAPSTFISDFLYADGQEWKGRKIPNWRERMICTKCELNNRIRGCIHFLEQNLGCKKDASIYISEQSTPLYRYLREHYAGLTGSEFIGDRIPYGAIDPQTGYRNESCTMLTFPDESLDFMLSFDVFEHVPDYLPALRECHRCLKKGGKMLFTVPFDMGATDTLVRATVDAQGNIEHLVEPSYHGDPINNRGILCFYTFGWDLLRHLREAGFESAEAHLYWAPEYGYLGLQTLLIAEK
jgi:SAM-dependent methyltransferase